MTTKLNHLSEDGAPTCQLIYLQIKENIFQKFILLFWLIHYFFCHEGCMNENQVKSIEYAYDFWSIMHFGQYFFCKNKRRTMEYKKFTETFILNQILVKEKHFRF